MEVSVQCHGYDCQSGLQSGHWYKGFPGFFKPGIKNSTLEILPFPCLCNSITPVILHMVSGLLYVKCQNIPWKPIGAQVSSFSLVK
jgi:hypothetical protein